MEVNRIWFQKKNKTETIVVFSLFTKKDGPVSYSIPQGDRRGYDVQFIDETYDGRNTNGTLNGKKHLCVLNEMIC